MSHPSDPRLSNSVQAEPGRRRILQALGIPRWRAFPPGRSASPRPRSTPWKLAITDTEVTVGLHSATGTMAISETGSIQAEQLAIDQINAMGACWAARSGHQGRRRPPTGPFAEKSRSCSSTTAVLPCLVAGPVPRARRYCPCSKNGLLYYPHVYEGLEQSKNVIYTGQEATQQILCRSLEWAKTEEGQELLPHWLRLHLAPYLDEDCAQAHRELPEGQGGG